MLELTLLPKATHLQLGSSLGVALHLEVQVESPDAVPFSLSSGRSLDECMIHFTVYADGVTDKSWNTTEDSFTKVGEMYTTLASHREHPPVIGITLYVYDYIFNFLASMHQTGKIPSKVVLGFEESTFLMDDSDGGTGDYKIYDGLPGVLEQNPAIVWYLFNA